MLGAVASWSAAPLLASTTARDRLTSMLQPGLVGTLGSRMRQKGRPLRGLAGLLGSSLAGSAAALTQPRRFTCRHMYTCRAHL